jgi:transcriptional regulator with XRE-family HTH domain
VSPEDEPLYAEIGIRVQGIRQANGLRQEDVAAAAGVTRSSIANLEAGRQSMPLGKLSLIAEYLGVTLSMLMPGAPLEGRALELREKYDAVAAARAALAAATADLEAARGDGSDR